jgi:glycosyltransferase involved in cell wall biosynthesis
MKIAYVTGSRTGDIFAWSGTDQGIRTCLTHTGAELINIDGIAIPPDFLFRLKQRAHRKLAHRRYRYERDPRYRRAIARLLNTRVRGLEVDLFFAPTALLCADVVTNRPVVTWCDAVFRGCLGYTPGFLDLAAETIRDATRWENDAIRRAALNIYSSDWAAGTAMTLHNAAPGRVAVVPFGANFPPAHTIPPVECCLAARPTTPCRLLLVGTRWAAKGGSVALEVCRRLNERGVPTELHVAGCEPPVDSPAFVKRHGFLAKNDAVQLSELATLYTESHFFVLPTTTECFGVVFAEASAYGLPVLAARTGGVPTAVREGFNGWTFDPALGAQPYVDCIAALWKSPETYRTQCRLARAEYERRLSWKSAALAVGRLLEGVVSQTKSPQSEVPQMSRGERSNTLLFPSGSSANASGWMTPASPVVAMQTNSLLQRTAPGREVEPAVLGGLSGQSRASKPAGDGELHLR